MGCGKYNASFSTGLLHDLDWLKSAEILAGKLPEQALSAIRAHDEMTGHKDESKLALALRASDAVSGLVIATALVVPEKNKFKVEKFSIVKKN